ncbi:PorP/SprF family type IX secretion system membrane protein [Mariniflexile sp.]|uniref:PorP/SprF family type IX secretion system membrane protein n=1 Tax=Mariniflexile sp. TaxID=1979402 RepID=UPI00404780CE
MKYYLLYIVLFFCFMQLSHSQDGVVSFALPVRNSLKFNKYVVNPTFSFVREQNKYITFTNKREWVQFENPPQAYLFSYSGRYNENTGVGLGLFQQNYGVLTTFGGVLNYAYNVVLDRDSNLTFGMNLGVYKSGINQGNVITNFPDPSLDNIPSNTMVTVNPGINYGTTFLDFGVSLNNVVLYNLSTSTLIEENPKQSAQAHAMYTGYLDSRGFFDKSKFSGLIRSEFSKEQTIVSGVMMLSIPKGMWAQAGYNTFYGLSAGIGFNLTNNIAIEYNYEKAMGDFSTFGNSHEFTLAYKFNKNYRYNYGDDDSDEGALIVPAKKTTRAVAKPKNEVRKKPGTSVNKQKEAEAKAKEAAEAKALLAAEKAKDDEERKIKLAEEARIKAETATKDALAAEEAKAKLEEENRMKLEAETKSRLAAEAKAKGDAETRAKLAAEKAKADAEAKTKLAAEKAKADEENRLRIAQEVAEAKAKAAEEARLELEAETQAKLASQQAAPKPVDEIAKPTEDVSKIAEDTKTEQGQLLNKLKETVAIKRQDLKDLKEENDLSEQGIYTQPKTFKSVTAENAAIESLIGQIDNVIGEQNNKIAQLENSYNQRLKKYPNADDATNMIYLNEIEIFKKEQAAAIKTKANLVSELEAIKKATEVERRRRIKRAAYDNEQDRYNKDRATLNVIKQTTPLSAVPLKQEDFDFGDEQSNIQIVKDVKNVENGYYVVLAVHSDVAKRDDFLTKAVAAGEKNINFFYDVNTSKYYIYYEKFDDIEDAQKALQAKGTKPYNSKMSMVKIEN